MCVKAVEKDVCILKFIPDHLKTREMCEKAVEKYPWLLEYIPACYKTKEMCNDAVWKIPCLLEYIALSVQGQLRLWDDDSDYHDDDDKLIEWSEVIKKKILKNCF